jgi:hypothetical protein
LGLNAVTASRPDNCYDNAYLESCFGKLKTELVMEVYADVRTARKEIRESLCYYDSKRRHSSLNDRTPCEFERFKERETSSSAVHQPPREGNIPSDKHIVLQPGKT